MKVTNMQAKGKEIKYQTNSDIETLELGKRIGKLLQSGDNVALVGELAAGKTWLAKGIAFGLGVEDSEYVNSPAFDLVHEYRGKVPVYHMDFYRLDALSNVDRQWLEEYLYGDGVCIIEWADKLIDKMVSDYILVKLSLGPSENIRLIEISQVGDRNTSITESLYHEDTSS